MNFKFHELQTFSDYVNDSHLSSVEEAEEFILPDVV